MRNPEEQECVYYDGFLARDRGRAWRGEPMRVAEAALYAATGPGLVHLVQRRTGDSRWQYIARKVRRRAPDNVINFAQKYVA